MTNSTQLAALAPEHEDPRFAWYTRFTRRPFYGSMGLNAGVLLMNMTRLRSVFFKVCLIVCSFFKILYFQLWPRDVALSPQFMLFLCSRRTS